MRSNMAFALCCLVACAQAPPMRPTVSVGVDVADVDELLRRYPLAPAANIRADEIGRTPGTSVHLVQVRGGESPHHHAAHDLTVMVLRGEGILHVARVERPMRAGDAAVVPRGVAHWYTSRSQEPSIALVVFEPPLDAPDSVSVHDVDSREDAR